MRIRLGKSRLALDRAMQHQAWSRIQDATRARAWDAAMRAVKVPIEQQIGSATPGILVQVRRWIITLW